MNMNLSIPPFHSEEPTIVQTSFYKGTQENLTVTQMLYNIIAKFPSTDDKRQHLKKNQHLLL